MHIAIDRNCGAQSTEVIPQLPFSPLTGTLRRIVPVVK
jgi:hypothetical protein